MPDSSASARFDIVDTVNQRGVLLDSGLLVAVAVREDGRHQEAVQCLKAAIDDRRPLFVSVSTIHETHRQILHRCGVVLARKFLSSVLDGTMAVIDHDLQGLHAGLDWIDRYSDQDFTITDAVNMALMVSWRFHAVMSFDKHFLIAGFRRVPPL